MLHCFNLKFDSFEVASPFDNPKVFAKPIIVRSELAKIMSFEFCGIRLMQFSS